MTTLTPSKYSGDATVFHAQPPDDPKLVKSLFVGRKKELDHALHTLKPALDIKGRRFKKGSKQPWAVHGESRNARIQRSILSEALIELNNTPGLDVIVTSRSWYVNARAEFMTLADLTHEMSPDELIAIHDLRFRQLGPRKAPNAFLDRNALLQLAQDSRGLPGVFLTHLDTAFSEFQMDTDWAERNYDWFLGVYRQRLDSMRDSCPAALDAMRLAVEENRSVIDIQKINPFFGTIFRNELVYQSYYAETNYFMSGIVKRLFGKPQEPLP